MCEREADSVHGGAVAVVVAVARDEMAVHCC